MQHPDYTTVRELGRGGSATVYLAVQNSLNRRVALKVLHAHAVDQGERFLREGRIIAKLDHPGIVPVYDVGALPDASGYFMTMEYLNSGNLRERMPAFSLADLYRTLDQVCQALSYAHEQGFIHRDVKPDNVLFRSPVEALLADFGIARATDSLTQLTVTGAMLGTPSYMSPEQVAGTAIDQRSDLYSLGIVLFEALAGYLPLHGDTPMSTGLQHLTGTPLPLPKALQHWQPLINRLLAKEPDKRPATAAQVREEIAVLANKWAVNPDSPLSQLHSGEPPERRPLTTIIAPRRRRIPLAIGAAAVAAVAIGFGVMLYLDSQSGPPIAPPATESAAPSPLTQLLDQAGESFAAERWLGPAPDAALSLYRQALELEPNHPVATERIATILTRSRTRAQRRIDAGELAAAEIQIAELATAFGSDQVTELRDSLQAAYGAAEASKRAQQRNARIAELLSQANAAMAEGRLTGDNSAVAHFRDVLAIDAQQPLARSGLNNVMEGLLARAARESAEGDFDGAEQTLAGVAAINPDNDRLVQLRAQNREARSNANEAQQQAAAQQQLANDVGALSTRVDAWLSAEDATLDAGYEQLMADLEGLLSRAPNERAVQRLLAATERHAGQLRKAQSLEQQAKEQPEEEERADRFRIPSF